MRLLFADLKALVAADLAASVLSCITRSRWYKERFQHSNCNVEIISHCGYVDPIRTTAPKEFAKLFRISTNFRVHQVQLELRPPPILVRYLTPILVLQKAILRVIRKKSKGVFVRIFSRSKFSRRSVSFTKNCGCFWEEKRWTIWYK